MTKLSKLLVVVGCLLILLAVALRVTLVPVMVGAKTIKHSSVLILANTALLLALVLKK
jgi:hypothetical protein